jgi:predicted NAD/FAD-dependent oxidoreductase
MISTSDPVIVLGAGLAGLTAARTLHGAGRDVIVFDKGRGAGGRMATRRFGDGRFDHGAQFFTVREPAFAALVERWLDTEDAALWANGFADASGVVQTDGHPRFRGLTGMTSVPKALAEGLDVRLETRITAVRREEDVWLLESEGGDSFRASALLMTPPVPQTLELLVAGGVLLPPDLHATLQSVTYAPCLALMLLLDGPSAVPAPGGLQLMSEPVFWIGDNYQKGISPGAHALTIHGAPQFSQDNWGADTAVIAALLMNAAEPWLGSAVRAWDLHRWRYSLPLTPLPQRFLALTDGPPLLFAGDAFGGPRVEGAALSGLAAAAALLETPVR